MNIRGRSTYRFGAFRLDPAEQRLEYEGRIVPLTPKIFELLRVLVENAGHLVEKEQLLREVWPGTFVEEANLNRGISVLRKALGEVSENHKFIETVPKRGYRFVAIVDYESKPASTDAVSGPTEKEDSPSSIPPPLPDRTASLRLIGIAAGTAVVLIAVIYSVLTRPRPAEQVVARGASVHRQLTFSGKEVTPSLSPDGTRIAYVSTGSPTRRVMVQELAGGRPIEIFSAPEAGALRWSPDGSDLIFWARGAGTDGVFIAPASGGAARKLAKGLYIACWSPDGSTIALALFVARRILFINRLGEEQRWIALHGSKEWIWDLDWSAANGRLLFVANDDARRPTIWSIKPDGSEQTRILSSTSEIPAARWAPSGDAVYYFNRVGQAVSLFKAFVRPDRNTTELPAAPLLSGLETDGSFALSQDGNRLVYARAPYHSNLWLVERVAPEGGGRIRQTQLTHGTSIVERPRVSPGGGSIVFNMGYESRSNLYTIPALGGTPKQLTFLNGFSVGGAWSPDGRTLAFASTEGGKPRVWIVNADGSSPRPLSQGDMSESFEIAWSPGARLLYQQAGNRNYYVLDPATRREHLLIKDSSVGWAGSPAYSPDGRKIAVAWNRRPNPGLWIIDSHDFSERLLWVTPDLGTSNPFPIGWSSDSSSLYAFDGKRAAYRGISVSFGETVTEAKILRMPLNGSQPETIVSLPFEEVGSVAMFPDARRFLCTVYSSRSDVWVVESFDAAVARLR